MRIGIIVAPKFNVMNLAPISVFEMTNTVLGSQCYEPQLISETGGLVRMSCGVEVVTEQLRSSQFDTLMATASREAIPAEPDNSIMHRSRPPVAPSELLRTRVVSSSPGVIEFLQHAVKTARRTTSICVGAFTLAEAGILDNKRATTHWKFAAQLQQRFPEVKVDADRIFVADGAVWTSAGATASIDLALALVEKDVGVDAAKVVAKTLVINQRRAGGQSQQSALLELDARTDRVQDALAFARQNLRHPLSIDRLAEAARLSPRQFRRVFRTETGQTPAKVIESLRLEAARLMLDQGRLPIEAIAQESGFGDGERMRRAFIRTYGRSPQHMRTASDPLVAF